MPGASLFPAVDAAYQGRFCEQLEAWRDEGLSLVAIQERIAEEIGWTPGRETLRRWVDGECS